MNNSSSDTPGILWLVLDEQSQQALRKQCPPRFNNEFYHHLTLRYGVPLTPELQALIGKSYEIEGYTEAFNKSAHALRVLPSSLPDEYGVPHITLSTAAGIEPFASVAMLQAPHDEVALPAHITLHGIVAFAPL